MMNQNEMFEYLQGRCVYHHITMEGNKIKGKRLIVSRSFNSFTITFLNNSDEISIKAGRGRTLKFSNQDDLFCFMGSFSYILDDKEYEKALKEQRRIAEEQRVEQERISKLDKFYYFDNSLKEFVEDRGEMINIKGYTCFIKEREDGNYNVVEAQTGLNFSSDSESKEDAKKAADQGISENEDRIESLIKNTIERNGISPLYKEEQAV